MNSYYRTKILERLKGNYTITEGNCHIWIRSCDIRGYGKTQIFGELYKVHVLSALLFMDLELDSKIYVRHKCVNRTCFNPDHLDVIVRKGVVKVKKIKLVVSGVYFVQVKEGEKLIKIGVSKNVYKRFDSIKNFMPTLPMELLAIIEGKYGMEKYLHKKFKEYNVGGEWFKPVPEILDFIKNCENIMLG